jgi:hypothetical protein
MHPIEHLRYVARATGADPVLVVREAASALAEMYRSEPAALVPACRRLIERHLVAGPVWWLSACMLGSADPVEGARAAIRELDGDLTAEHLANLLPDEATVVIVGWPDVSVEALRSRGDLEVLVVDSSGEGASLVRRLVDRGTDAQLVPDSGTGPAAAVADVVLVDALAAGPGGLLASPGSLAAASVAVGRLIPVWAVTGVGRVLPERLWGSLLTRLDESGDEPWERQAEVVPSDLFVQVVSTAGASDVAQGLSATTCPAAAELFRAAG